MNYLFKLYKFYESYHVNVSYIHSSNKSGGSSANDALLMRYAINIYNLFFHLPFVITVL